MEDKPVLYFKSDEAKRHTYSSGVSKRITMYNDGVEYFVMNLYLDYRTLVPCPNSLRDLQDATNQLTLSDGRYMCMKGRYSDPFMLLDRMEQFNLHFSQDEAKIGYKELRVVGIADNFQPVYEVMGCLAEEDLPFNYRFYCLFAFDWWQARASQRRAADYSSLFVTEEP